MLRSESLENFSNWDVPVELELLILSFLPDYSDKLSASLVCHHWKELVQELITKEKKEAKVFYQLLVFSRPALGLRRFLEENFQADAIIKAIKGGNFQRVMHSEADTQEEVEKFFEPQLRFDKEQTVMIPKVFVLAKCCIEKDHQLNVLMIKKAGCSTAQSFEFSPEVAVCDIRLINVASRWAVFKECNDLGINFSADKEECDRFNAVVYQFQASLKHRGARLGSKDTHFPRIPVATTTLTAKPTLSPASTASIRLPIGSVSNNPAVTFAVKPKPAPSNNRPNAPINPPRAGSCSIS